MPGRLNAISLRMCIPWSFINSTVFCSSVWPNRKATAPNTLETLGSVFGSYTGLCPFGAGARPICIVRRSPITWGNHWEYVMCCNSILTLVCLEIFFSKSVLEFLRLKVYNIMGRSATDNNKKFNMVMSLTGLWRRQRLCASTATRTCTHYGTW